MTVERISWERGAVVVEARSAVGAALALRARSVIVTVPVGVLQQREGPTRMTFSPPLPAEKETALRGLAMGHVVRVTLAFRTPFWESIAGGRYRDAAFFRSGGGRFAVFWTQMPVRSRTIVAWVGGPRATALGGLSVHERIERARDEFGAMFDARDLARAECEDGVTHDWTTDPFARGAYSYVIAGAGAARAALAAPVGGTIFFAGEAAASDGQGGTVSGAFQTGTRAGHDAARALEAGGTTSPTVS